MPTKNLDLFTQRYIQIVLVMMLVQAAYQYMHIPHSQWLITGICSLYSGFDPDQVIKRAGMRVSGTIVGIALVVLVWYVVHWNFRLLIILTTLMIGLIVFFRQLPYSQSVILNTAFSDISTEWSNKTSFSLYYYLSDRLLCTLIVFALCIAVEKLWFGRKNLSYLNYLRTQQITYANLKRYYTLVSSRNNSGTAFKLADTLLQNILKLSNLAAEVQKEAHNSQLSQELHILVTTILEMHNKIVSLSYLKDINGDPLQIKELACQIEQTLLTLNK